MKLNYIGNYGSNDIKLQEVTMAAKFKVSKVLLMRYNTDIRLSEDESCCDKGEEAHAYQGPSVILPR